MRPSLCRSFGLWQAFFLAGSKVLRNERTENPSQRDAEKRERHQSQSEFDRAIRAVKSPLIGGSTSNGA